MGLVEAKCTNCGATLSVNRNVDVMNCPYCGSEFIVEKAIQNFNNVYNITNQIAIDKVFIKDSSNSSDFIIKNNSIVGYQGRDKHVIIPNGVIEIEGLYKEGAYLSDYYNPFIEVVELPPSVKKVNFSGLKSLKKVFPLNNIIEVKSSGFEGTMVEELDLSNVKKIGYGAFLFCKELKILKVSREAFESTTSSWTSHYNYDNYCDKLEKFYIDGVLITPDMPEAHSIAISKTPIYNKADQIIKENWIKAGKCKFCGGELKGLFTKICKKCNKKQN